MRTNSVGNKWGKVPFIKDENGTYCAKRKYLSEREARQALKKGKRAGCVAYYQCPMCGNWHLTSQRQH